MEAIVTLLLVVLGLLVLDLAAIRFGHDSREPYEDDHRRSTYQGNR